MLHGGAGARDRRGVRTAMRHTCLKSQRQHVKKVARGVDFSGPRRGNINKWAQEDSWGERWDLNSRLNH
jgi:hypothetical protein